MKTECKTSVTFVLIKVGMTPFGDVKSVYDLIPFYLFPFLF